MCSRKVHGAHTVDVIKVYLQNLEFVVVTPLNISMKGSCKIPGHMLTCHITYTFEIRMIEYSTLKISLIIVGFLYICNFLIY